MTTRMKSALIVGGAMLLAGCAASDDRQAAAMAWHVDATQGWQEDHWKDWQVERQQVGDVVHVQGRNVTGDTFTGTERRNGHIRVGTYRSGNDPVLHCLTPRAGSIDTEICF